MIGIYKVTNTINNKKYIGQSVNITDRWREHRNRASYSTEYLYQAMRKYGISNFTFEVVEECLVEELDDKERYWIEHYNTLMPNGYNMTDGGQDRHTNYIHLSPIQIKEIQELLIEQLHISINEIANMFNVSFQTISDINTGKTHINNQLSYPLRERYASQRIVNQLNFQEKTTCKQCGNPLSGRGKTGLCPSCYKKTLRITERPESKQLAQEIIESSFCAVGKKYGVSDNAIRKWCKSYGIPTKKDELKEWLSNQ